MPYVVRFFRVVSPVPRLMAATWAVTVLAGALAIGIAPERARDALGPVLLLQLFAAASGFSAPARRGYYDLLLTREPGRVRAALVHWGMSVYPGVASWLALAAVEALAREAPRALLASGSMMAVLLVSTLPWALTAALPRYAAAIGWLLVLAIGRMIVPDAEVPPAVQFLAYPVSLVGVDLTQEHPLVALPSAIVALLAMAGACAWIHRADIPLEASQ